MKNRLVICFGIAFILVTLFAPSSEACHHGRRHHHNWMNWGGNNMMYGYGNSIYGRGYGNPYYGAQGYGNSLYGPAGYGYGYGRPGVVRTILRNFW